jgi:adenylate kinase family enzyme
MEGFMPKQVVIFIGPITAGKGTQALWLEREKEYVHLESTHVIRKQFAEHPDDPLIKDEKDKVARGDIVDPPIILQWMLEAIAKIAEEGKSLTLSGSPRSRFEAEGGPYEIKVADETLKGTVTGLYPKLEEIYGPQNLHTIYLALSEEDAVKRSLARRVCKAKGHPVPDLPKYRNLTTCPFGDNSPLIRRTDGLDDDERIIRKRYRDYMKRLGPIMDYLHEREYQIVEIDGNESIEAIHAKVVELTERQRFPVPEN